MVYTDTWDQQAAIGTLYKGIILPVIRHQWNDQWSNDPITNYSTNQRNQYGSCPHGDWGNQEDGVGRMNKDLLAWLPCSRLGKLKGWTDLFHCLRSAPVGRLRLCRYLRPILAAVELTAPPPDVGRRSPERVARVSGECGRVGVGIGIGGGVARLGLKGRFTYLGRIQFI